MAGRQTHALRRDETGEGIVRGRQIGMYRRHHLLQRVRAGDGQHLGMTLAHQFRARAETAGDDHPSVLVERLGDGVQGLIDRRIDEAAGVDDDQIGLGVSRLELIALGTQSGEDTL
jgi:hypothetical protein